MQTEDNSSQPTDNDLNLYQNSLEGKVVSVGLKTLRIQIVHKKCKPEVILTDGMFDCEKCNKMSSEIECLKILKVAFSIVCINERFNSLINQNSKSTLFDANIQKEETGKENA